ncbi:ribose-phosphate pyrophosphokinase [Pseudomonas phage phiK7A1]|uniref:Ribose-phosphate pyrophosphokinase n=1 Tax=Pseudomonas phage phiK7A1 TaxID=2759194 RepID=A0A7H0XFN3_9CAUD|nr:ribose-phosphate pyrophosphokinase [Pseudomonas phage phiK7A1]
MEFNQKLFYAVSTNYNIRHSVDVIKFPGGEVNVNINSGSLAYDDREVAEVTGVRMEARITSMDDLFALFLATDAIRRVYAEAAIDLFIPYFPYARQDRVCNSGEALSVQVMGKLINAQGYTSVIVVDPHSAVTPAVIDRCLVWDQFDVFSDIKQDWSEWTIVAPDQGAVKKCEDFAKRVGAKAVVGFNKTRELSTGKITGMVPLFEPDPDAAYLVLDDICDGGRTFIELVSHMSYVGTLELAVTHGIFSKGVGIVADHFDMVHTSNSLPQTAHSKLNVVEI